jgi:serine/threonine protein kinase
MGAELGPGAELAGHRILELIGRGGMSVVYLAEHVRLDRKVALKILSPELAEDDVFRERFIRESRVAAGLDHPNIVTVYDAGEAQGALYISMRYVPGRDLGQLLKERGTSCWRRRREPRSSERSWPTSVSRNGWMRWRG